MEAQVSPALRRRLGDDGVSGLLEFGQAWSERTLTTASDRFERRMVEETAKLRVEMSAGFATLREEMTAGFARVREEMAQLESRVRVDIANTRSELLKWAFLFWVGQAATVAGLMALMLRTMR